MVDVPHSKADAPKGHDKLSHEGAEALLHPRYRKHNWAALKLDFEPATDGIKAGYFKVTADNEGYSLSLIASRALAMRGRNPEDKDALKQEMDRIVALNVDKYSSLAKNRNFLGVNWKLKIWDESVGPDPTAEWKPWKVAEAGSQISVGRGERVIARAGSSIVVEPGGEARLDPGSKAFLAQDGYISAALPGSRILAVGGEIHDYGATIIAPNPGDLKVIREDPAKLAALVKSENAEAEVAKLDPPKPIRKPTTEYASNFFGANKSANGLPVVELY